MSELVTEPLVNSTPTKSCDDLFWRLFTNPQYHINEQEVDRDLLRKALISHGCEAGEAVVIIEYYLRIGAIARFNTTTFIKTTLYDQVQKTAKENSELRELVKETKITNQKNSIFFIPPELSNRGYANILLSKDGSYFEVDEGGKVVRFLSTETYNKEFKS